MKDLPLGGSTTCRRESLEPLTFTAGPVCLCGVSSPVVVLGLFVRLS